MVHNWGTLEPRFHPAALLAPATGTPSDRPLPLPQHPRRMSTADADPPFWGVGLGARF